LARKGHPIALRDRISYLPGETTWIDSGCCKPSPMA